jgi:signal transduction histidine kinase
MYEIRSGWLGITLSLLGAVVVGYALILQATNAYIPPWVLVIGLIADGFWIITSVLRMWSAPVWATVAVSAIMVVAGSLGAAPTNGLLLVPAAVGVLQLTGTRRLEFWVGCAGALLGSVLVVIGSFGVTMTPLGLVSMVGGIALGLLGGLNRRQATAARERQQELVERTIIAREEHARAMSLEARQRVARDIHDVLAHSLGGVVVQLNAVEALLEAGRTEDAEVRIRDAREMAASGLGEARRAVDALRTPTDDTVETDVVDLETSLRELIAAHRSTGGSVSFDSSGDARPVPASVALAMRRALQESLSNARKHAPGAPVSARIIWEPRAVIVTVSNPVQAPDPSVAASPAGRLAATGGGNGLVGMRERFAELDGGVLFAGMRDDCFVVAAEAGLA